MSKKILAVLGFLALELINEDDLIGVMDHEDQVALYQALAELNSFSLIKRKDQHVGLVHALIHEYSKETNAIDDQVKLKLIQLFIKYCIEKLNQCKNEEDIKRYDLGRDQAHIEYLIQSKDCNPILKLALIHCIGPYYEATNQYTNQSILK